MLDPDERSDTTLGRRDGREQFGDEGFKISESIRTCAQYDDRDVKGRKILLKRKIPIDSNKYRKLFRGQSKQLSVLYR